MKIVTIIQARMGSSRLPKKVLMPLTGKPVIKWVYDRASLIKGVSETWVATTTDKSDDPLYEYCKENDIPVFRGNLDDVLDRYYQLAEKLNPDAVIRITGDCPLLDPKKSSECVDAFVNNQPCDYVKWSNFLPDGLDTEVVAFKTLEEVWKNAKLRPYREHVTFYINEHKEEFNNIELTLDTDYSHHRWTIDEPKDYEFLSKITDKLKEKNMFGHMEEVLKILDENPQFMDLNYDITRDKWREDSLKEIKDTL